MERKSLRVPNVMAAKPSSSVDCAMRRDIWPEPTLLKDKLYGNLEELRRTAAFVRAIVIST